ncbi:MAG: hypothetical protein ACXWRA_06300 [Pseudobdellovibrionaceae bacterium]
MVKENKRLPPHIAYLESHFDIPDSEWKDFEKKSKRPLAVGLTESLIQPGPYVITQRRDLEGLIIHKDPENLVLTANPTYKISARIVPESDNSQWLKNIVRETGPSIKNATEESVHNLTAIRRVAGPIEITGGLAVTNEHHIEVRRADEGVFHEMGQVDLIKGSYSIDINEASGIILARLMDKNGIILGEGGIRISQLRMGSGRLISGPRLEISPSPIWTGRVSHYYPNSKKENGSSTRVTTFGGENSVAVGKNGEITLENFSRNSTTIVRAEESDQVPSCKIMVAGAKPFGITLFPKSMMKALKRIVTDQKNIPSHEFTETSVVWGTASLDGKPLSGVTVVSETEPEVQAIYFNEFMIPDPKLTATSSVGIYAFIGLADGFHALLGQRGGAYFGHQNVEVEVGSVAIGDIENTLHTESIRIRAFDAFKGEPVTLTANLQSLEQSVEVVNGAASIVLPQISRLSMIYTQAPPAYISANYFYNDQDSYIHMPVISKEWLAEIKAIAKFNELPQTGTIIGFFNEENFEVYLAGQTKDSSIEVVYFDASGKLSDSHQGVPGGGFIIFNAPYGTQEIVVVGSNSEKISSKVVPVDVDTASVLSFTSF